MFANPEVSAFIDRLIGGQTPHGGTPPQSSGSRTDLARALFGDITKPAIRGGFAAPSIESYRHPLMQPLPTTGVGRESGSGAPGQADFRGGQGNTGASGLASGIGKVGAGIESGLEQLAANKQAADEKAARSQGGAFPKFGGGISGDATADSTGGGGGLPSFAQQPGVSTGTPSTAPSGAGAGLKNQIAQHIVDYAISRGVDPYRALGIAAREGLDRANPLATNPDGSIGGRPNTAIGFYQFGTQGLGKTLGISVSTPWKTQAEMAIDYMATHSPANVTSQWHSIPDNGGWNAIRDIGRGYAAKLGISPGGGSQPAAAPTPISGQPSPTSADIAQDRQQDAADTTRGASSTTPPTGIVSQPTQQGTYGGQPYTFQTKPALGPQGMLTTPQTMPQIDPLALALAGGQMPSIDPNFGGSGSGLFG